jgi:hypothetical protein
LEVSGAGKVGIPGRIFQFKNENPISYLNK